MQKFNNSLTNVNQINFFKKRKKLRKTLKSFSLFFKLITKLTYNQKCIAEKRKVSHTQNVSKTLKNLLQMKITRALSFPYVSSDFSCFNVWDSDAILHFVSRFP